MATTGIATIPVRIRANYCKRDNYHTDNYPAKSFYNTEESWGAQTTVGRFLLVGSHSLLRHDLKIKRGRMESNGWENSLVAVFIFRFVSKIGVLWMCWKVSVSVFQGGDAWNAKKGTITEVRDGVVSMVIPSPNPNTYTLTLFLDTYARRTQDG